MALPLLVGAGAFFKAIPWQLYVIGGVIVVVGFVTFGFFDSQNKLIEAANKRTEASELLVTKQQEQIAALQMDKNTLTTSNQSLEIYITNLQSGIDRVISETQSIIKSDAAYLDKVNALEKVIADEVRNDRIKAIRQGTKSELLLNYINKNVECYIANFDKVNGKCVQGVWRKDE